MHSKTKGQVSIETMFTVTVVLTILVILTTTAITENNTVSTMRAMLYQQDKCKEISGMLDTLALHAGSGKATINIRGYEVWITSNGTIIIKATGGASNPSFCGTIAQNVLNETGGKTIHADGEKEITIHAIKSWDSIIIRKG